MVPPDVIAAAMQSNPRMTADPLAMNPLMNFPDPGLLQDDPATFREGPADLSGGMIGRRFVVPVDMSLEPSQPVEIGMGIPLSPDEPVTSVDLAPAPPENAAMRALSSLSGRGGGGFRMPAPIPTAPRRQVGSRPEFIYTNPVAAQQAASNYSARLAAETGQERGFQDYASRIAESQAVNDRANIIGQQQAAQLEAAKQESAANRTSAERIAGMSEAVRQQRMAESAWAENERAAEIGEQTAAMLNSDPNARVDRKFAWQNPATGRWESRFRRQARPASMPGVTAPVPVGAPVPAAPIAVPQPAAPAAAPAAPAAPVAPAENPSLMRRIWEMAPLNAVGIGNAIGRALTP